MAKKDAIQVPAKLETSEDRIYFSFLSAEVEATLTAQELEQRTRIDEAWHYLLKRKSPLATAEWLQSKRGISRATAFRIVKQTLRIFGDVVKTTKEQKRLLMWEYSLNGLKMAEALGDMRAYAAILKNMTTFEGLNVEDKESSLEALQAHTFLIELKGNAGKPVQFNVDKIEELEEATYAQVVDAVENMTISAEDMEEIQDKAEKKGKSKK